ncbi:MAG: Pr6Pr family membrane protein [Bifidobacteriaceae bacterium]|nr:Pr6Pr family membrane protein [Bifidobacteriaceae bacterium]
MTTTNSTTTTHTMKPAAPSRYVAGVYRLVLAFFCIAGTSETWTFRKPANFVYFTHQTNMLLGIVMLWAAIASFRGTKQPPAWLKGMLTLNILITGLVAGLILPPSDPSTFVYLPFLPGIPLVRMVHVIAPIMAGIDFLVFDEHRRYKWSYAFWWLLYFPIYLAFVLIRAQIWPHSGPEAGSNPYPYPFVNLPQIGWAGLGKNIVIYMSAFCLAGLLLCLIDHLLPRYTPLTGCAPSDELHGAGLQSDEQQGNGRGEKAAEDSRDSHAAQSSTAQSSTAQSSNRR